MSEYISLHYSKQEIEQKIADIKSVQEKDISSFERHILSDVLKKWEKALLDMEGGAAE